MVHLGSHEIKPEKLMTQSFMLTEEPTPRPHILKTCNRGSGRQLAGSNLKQTFKSFSYASGSSKFLVRKRDCRGRKLGGRSHDYKRIGPT